MGTSTDIFETYLQGLRLVRGTGSGVDELSYYPALHTLLSDVGKTLRPNVRPVMNLRNRGAGLPDGGLFTPDQIGRQLAEEQILGQVPARGAIEVKGTGDDIDALAASEQVKRYCQRYGQVLVTNLRDFSLVAQDRDGSATQMETYRLAHSESDFWLRINRPRAFTDQHGERFIEYLRRVMLHGAPLSNPQDLAWLLASYAREARMRIEDIQLHALTTVRRALEDALGVTFEGERGDHFFRSTLVQTLFYGIFSAWVLWSKEYAPNERAKFNWHETTWILHVPMIRALFEQIATPHRLGALKLVEVLDWAGAALNRVDRAAFFERFEQANAVQYFYEPFLEAFDPELRKALGVWYTPDEVVKYMVARVDRVLRDELDLPDGLADSSVYVLDPATGTGSYLVEVLRTIEATLRERGDDALAAHDVKQAAMERVIGFELLPAPFVVGHLQVGLYLQSIGAPLTDEKYERAAIYLTNSLTGWKASVDGQEVQTILDGYPELLQERDQARVVKQKNPVLVILGNPPYNGYAGLAMDEERTLTDAYRTAKRTRQPQGQGLNDLYVRFFRMAERRIVEGTGRGVVCLISNYSWLDGLSFTGMREHYLDVFDRIWIDCLNGDKYKTGKVTPDGLPDPSIFSTERNREGIQVGTAIATMVRNGDHQPASEVCFRHLWGRDKRAELLASADDDLADLYEPVEPLVELGLPFMPLQSEAAYFEWPSLPDLYPTSFPGVKTSRDDVVVDIDRDRLIRRMEQYFDPSISHDDMRRIAPGVMESTRRFNAVAIREQLQARGFLPENIVRYCYRPFDVRWLYWEPDTKLLDEKRSEYFPHVSGENWWLEARQKQPTQPFDRGIITRAFSDQIGNGMSSFFPMLLRPVSHQRDLFSAETGPSDGFRPNVSSQANNYIHTLTNGANALPKSGIEPLFFHTVAMIHSMRYRLENEGALHHDWPRIPLPATGERLTESANLGRLVARLLDTDTPVVGVTTGSIRGELRVIGPVTRVGGGDLNPDAGDLAVTAGWGYGGRGGITMPGRGRAEERDFTPEEREQIEAGVLALGLEPDEAFARLGETTFDIYLNDIAYWRNVPVGVWEYTIGGYQVMKKWLSYREQPLLGRPLHAAEAREVRDIARRIAALLLLGPALDASYAAVKSATYPWGIDVPHGVNRGV